MQLENRIQALIAVGASVTANCRPCLQAAIKMALESRANEREIAEAIEVGQRVRRGAASKTDTFASELIVTLPSPVAEVNGKCECNHP